jgi:predicted nucleic acid-binding protein
VAWLAGVTSDELHVSVLTLGEIKRGVELLRSRDPHQSRAIDEWLGALHDTFADRILGIDTPVAAAWGRLRAEHTLAIVDSLIAATALVHGLTLVTRDTRTAKRAGVPFLEPWQPSG